MLLLAAATRRIYSAINCHCTISYLLLIIWATQDLQTSKFAGAATTNGTLLSIDEVILESFQSTNESGRMHHPSVLRVELDMLFPADTWLAMIRQGSTERRQRRKALRNETLRWPKAEVPYTLAASFTNQELRVLEQAMADYHTYTCIRFRRKQQGDEDYVRIIGEGGCASYVGRVGGVQELWLHSSCRKKSIIIHELGHAIGFAHEHSRPDRDRYVTIYKENVRFEFERDFEKYSSIDINDGGIAYDYSSIMHYGPRTASRNRQTVIETKDPKFQAVIGTGKGLSFKDVKLANIVYRCSERSRCRKKVCPGEGFVGQDCRCWCPSNNTDIAAVPCPGCVDYDSFCPVFKQRDFCNNRILGSWMKDQCPRSCGLCI